jgi:hypothetical protein
MGNIPLKVFMEELYTKQTLQSSLFSSVILSSADIPTMGHQKWVEKIDFADSVHIIQNQRDLVLSLSTVFDEDPQEWQGPRLGKGFDDSTYTHIEDLAVNANYLDVTRSSAFGHRPFNMSSYPYDTNATRLVRLLLNGQSVEFPNPAIGLYQIPDLSPVFYFYSNNNLNKRALDETIKGQTLGMEDYIELRASQFYSEEDRREKLIPLNASEKIISMTGDWRLAKGEWQTTWNNRKVKLAIIDDTRVEYAHRNGRIIFYSIDKRGKWEGYWVEDRGISGCGSFLKDGSSHWGKVTFQFNEDYTSFRGEWDYCGIGFKTPWHGHR